MLISDFTLHLGFAQEIPTTTQRVWANLEYINNHHKSNATKKRLQYLKSKQIRPKIHNADFTKIKNLPKCILGLTYSIHSAGQAVLHHLGFVYTCATRT